MSSTELFFAVVQREVAVSNGVKLSKEECRPGKSGQIAQWVDCVEVFLGDIREALPLEGLEAR